MPRFPLAAPSCVRVMRVLYIGDYAVNVFSAPTTLAGEKESLDSNESLDECFGAQDSR